MAIMWILTPLGFFSIVQKPADVATNTLTVRARVREDLEALREAILPEMGRIEDSHGTDYRYRAVAPRQAVASALASLATGLDYQNFKDAVAERQGHERAALYGEVWSTLRRAKPPKLSTKAKISSLAAPATKAATVKPGPVKHPHPDDHGKPVTLTAPTVPSALSAWSDANSLACVVPNGPMPAGLGGVAFEPWAKAPDTLAGWALMAAEGTIDEPDFIVKAGVKRSAGVVIREQDGRVWLVAPSNGFGGYQHTFPKGTLGDGLSAQATALKETYEETGLRVRLISHLVDVTRTTGVSRYYLAERFGGTPSNMGWESQAVLLVPEADLLDCLNSPLDHKIVAALLDH